MQARLDGKHNALKQVRMPVDLVLERVQFFGRVAPGTTPKPITPCVHACDGIFFAWGTCTAVQIMCSLDPYGLLGASITSTPSQVKQAFYALSLLVHPDKGGSAQDMIMVHNAYKYVMSQLSGINRTVTVEDLEARFAAFCNDQENETPPFADIRNEVSMRQFHETFEMQKPELRQSASYTSGYGTSMQPSEYLPIDVKRARQACAAEKQKQGQKQEQEQDGDGDEVQVPFEMQIMTYVEPDTSGTDTKLCFTDAERADSLEDYGSTRPFQMTDYRAAFNTIREVLPDVSDLILKRTFDQLLLSRAG